jgi:2'-5' RNA ligase
MGPVVGRFGKRILHVPAGGLDVIADAAIAATAQVGEPPDPRPFHGHVTLARSRRGDTDLRPLAGVPIEGRWRADEVTLVSSQLGRPGARYEVIERVTLT